MYPIYYLAILAAGAVVELIPIQSSLASEDISARMEQADAKLLITDNKFFELSKRAAEQAGGIPLFVPENEHDLFGEDVPEFCGFYIDSEHEAADSPAFLNRTSGSTGGKLKTVVTTHAHFIATLEATIHTIPANTDPDVDVWLSTLSLGFFINAKLNIGLNILLGIPCVLMDRPFNVGNFDVIERHHITFLFIPPPVAASIAGDDRTKGVDVSSVKWLLSAGASMHEGLQKSVSRKLNNVHLDLEWGTTETLLIAIHREGHASPQGSSGTLVNGIEARVIDTETGEDVGPNESGEILVRNSACRFAGYKNNESANKSTFDDQGWFHSGDFGYLDDQCNVYITDRMKELIRVGDGYGVHISAVELEAIIFEHPAVAQVIVVGVPDLETSMDRATAFVKLSTEWVSQEDAAMQALEQWTKEKLTGLKALVGGIVILDAFPTIGFKINRRALKALATVKRGLQQVVPITEGMLQAKAELPKLDLVAAKIVVPTPAAVAA